MGDEPIDAQPLRPIDRERMAALTAATVKLRDATRVLDWSAIRDRAWQCLGIGRGALIALRIEDEQAARIEEYRSSSAAALLAYFREEAGSPEGRARLAEARDRLPSRGPGTAERLRDTLDALVEGDTSRLRRVDAVRTASRRAVHDLAIGACVRGLLGLVHHGAHAVFGAEAEGPALRPVIDQTLGAHEEEHRARIETIWGARRDSTRLGGAVREVSSAIEVTAVRLAVLAARAYRAAIAVREAGRGGEAETLGDLARRATALLRAQIADYAASLRVQAEHGLGEWSAPTADVLHREDVGRAGMALPNGRDVELHRLDGESDGAYVEVRGFVTGTAAQRPEPNKLVGAIRLVDPSSGAAAWIVGPFFHPAHSGVVAGAYLRATGQWRPSSVLRGGQPAVELDALPITQLTAESWRFAFAQLARPWFSIWPNRLHLSWSLGPHESTADDATTQGAAELIHPPIVRSER